MLYAEDFIALVVQLVSTCINFHDRFFVSIIQISIQQSRKTPRQLMHLPHEIFGEKVVSSWVLSATYIAFETFSLSRCQSFSC